MMGCITVNLYPLREYLPAAPRLSKQQGAIRSHQVPAIVPWYFSLSADPRYFTNTSRAPCIALVLFVLGPFRPFQVSLLLRPKKPINGGADACFARHQNLECIISSPKYVRPEQRHRQTSQITFLLPIRPRYCQRRSAVAVQQSSKHQ
jgi:hypothetical protein